MKISLLETTAAIVACAASSCFVADSVYAQSYNKDSWGYAHQGQTWGNQRYERKGGNDATPTIYDNKTNTYQTCVNYAHGIVCK
jgi:hypothetical protein